MYPGSFEYVAPDSVDAAVRHLAAASHDGLDARVLAGGHSLLPRLKRSGTAPDLLVDVGGIDALRGVAVDGSTITVGAATTYADARRADAVGRGLPALADALAVVGDRQVRNRGTVGGNLVQAEVGTDVPAPALVHGGRLVVRGPDGDRTVALGRFYENGAALAPTELLTAVELRAAAASAPAAAGAYVKREHPHTGYPLVGVAAVLEFERDAVTAARVAATGATAAAPAVRLPATEAAITGSTPAPGGGEVIADAAARARTAAAPDSFPGAAAVSPVYRSQLLEVYTERALRRTVDRSA